MSIPLALPAATRPPRGVPPSSRIARVPSRDPTSSPREAERAFAGRPGKSRSGGALAGSGQVVGWLVTGGALLNALALATFSSLRCFGLLNLDTMTLLPAVACAGAAAMSFGVALACWRALRGA